MTRHIQMHPVQPHLGAVAFVIDYLLFPSRKQEEMGIWWMKGLHVQELGAGDDKHKRKNNPQRLSRNHFR